MSCLLYRHISESNFGTQLLSADFFNQIDSELALSRTGIRSSSFSTARSKLSWEVFPYLLSKIETKSESLWKGHRVRAVDGTGLTLPYTKEVLEHFPRYAFNTGSVYYPRAKLIAATEISTGKVTHTLLGSRYMAERISLIDLLPQFDKGDISLLDRGFDGKKIWREFKKQGQYFVGRFKSNGPNVIKGFVKKKREQVLKIEEKGCKDILKIRIIKIYNRKSKSSIYLVTNLIDKKKYSRRELSKLYKKRQVVEESFKQMKKSLDAKLEYRAKRLNSVLQEIYAAVLAVSLISIVRTFEKSTQEKRVLSFIGARYAIRKLFKELLFEPHQGGTEGRLLEIILSHYHHGQQGRIYPRMSLRPVNKWIVGGRRRSIEELRKKLGKVDG